METMPLVSFENQLSGFYITSTLTLNGIRAGHMKDQKKIQNFFIRDLYGKELITEVNECLYMEEMCQTSVMELLYENIFAKKFHYRCL